MDRRSRSKQVKKESQQDMLRRQGFEGFVALRTAEVLLGIHGLEEAYIRVASLIHVMLHISGHSTLSVYTEHARGVATREFDAQGQPLVVECLPMALKIRDVELLDSAFKSDMLAFYGPGSLKFAEEFQSTLLSVTNHLLNNNMVLEGARGLRAQALGGATIDFAGQITAGANDLTATIIISFLHLNECLSRQRGEGALNCLVRMNFTPEDSPVEADEDGFSIFAEQPDYNTVLLCEFKEFTVSDEARAAMTHKIPLN